MANIQKWYKLNTIFNLSQAEEYFGILSIVLMHRNFFIKTNTRSGRFFPDLRRKKKIKFIPVDVIK